MSAFIRKVLSQAPRQPKTEELTLTLPDGETNVVRFRAFDDAEVLLQTIVPDPERDAADAATWSEALRQMLKDSTIELSVQMVQYVKLVHAALDTGGEYVDVVEIALLAKRHGSIFMQMVEKASSVFGVEELGAKFMDDEAGNSSDALDQPGKPSGSGRSKQPAKSSRPSSGKVTATKK